MTDNLPDYEAMNPSEDKAPEEYSTHERRAYVLREVLRTGSPFAVNQSRLAEKYNVHRSTVSQDFGNGNGPDFVRSGLVDCEFEPRGPIAIVRFALIVLVVVVVYTAKNEAPSVSSSISSIRVYSVWW